MDVIVCPGIHDRTLTQAFVEKLAWEEGNCLILPTDKYAAYSGLDVLQFLRDSCDRISLNSPIAFIGFSAGAVGAIGAAWGWQLLGGNVKALIALDAWGLPLMGNFPIHRLSHDYFTYWSSALLGAGEESFYADPPVAHLELWRNPDSAQGWWVRQLPNGTAFERVPTSAASYLRYWLHHYYSNSL